MRHVLTTAAASLALALIAAVPAVAATTLHLSASATVRAMPDELEATLSANAEAPAPAAAQAAVNAMVSRALQAARAVAAVTVSTGSYSVWQITNPHPSWHASQNLVVSAGDGTAVLDLVGTLQQDGLAVSSLEWRLKPETEKNAHDQAETMALAALKQKAERTAKLLGMHFAGFRQIWLTEPPTPPRPMAMMAARAMPEPNAVPAEASVTATVTAEATLVP
ncbi:MAG: SIMPL domain-containing protein [Acetobacteraceae bacterium]